MIPIPASGSVLPHGLGRSYGDSCLNEAQTLLLTRGLDRFLGFEPETGVLLCEAGVSLGEILELFVPRGWFLPVTPGTRHVTVGGAIANDVHGKNHHKAGTFGAQTLGFELLRSDGTRRWCSRTENIDLFRATIGGLGLTGLMTSVSLKLRPISSPWIDEEQLRMPNLKSFFTFADDSDSDYEYTVAWLDTLARGEALGRGIFMRGNHHATGAPPYPHERKLPFGVPLDAPPFLLNRASIKVFNTLYARKFRGERHRSLSRYESFFYPLDVLGGWNRLYGKRGFYQYQCVVPREGDGGPIREILERISASGESSFLAVLKCFGKAPPESLLSFPRPGVTLALDFPNRGSSTRKLMDELDSVVLNCGGALYPAKDARMSKAVFLQSFPDLNLFIPHIDPAFSSSFWRRVQQES